MDEEWQQEALGKIKTTLTEDRADVDPDRTIGGQIIAWVRYLQGKQRAGNISAGRLDAYERNIRIFRDWIKAGSEITVLNALSLDNFYTFLNQQIGAGRYSPSYAKSIFTATRQFVSRLGELDLIPLPGNIRKKFSFDDAPGHIEQFTIAEVKKLTKHGSPAARLLTLSTG